MSEDAQYIFLPKSHQAVNTLTEICLPFVALCTLRCLLCSQANNSGQTVINAVHEGQGCISRLTFGTPVPITTGGVTGLIVSALTNEVVKAAYAGSALLMDWKWSESYVTLCWVNSFQQGDLSPGHLGGSRWGLLPQQTVLIQGRAAFKTTISSKRHTEGIYLEAKRSHVWEPHQCCMQRLGIPLLALVEAGSAHVWQSRWAAALPDESYPTRNKHVMSSGNTWRTTTIRGLLSQHQTHARRHGGLWRTKTRRKQPCLHPWCPSAPTAHGQQPAWGMRNGCPSPLQAPHRTHTWHKRHAALLDHAPANLRQATGQP